MNPYTDLKTALRNCRDLTRRIDPMAYTIADLEAGLRAPEMNDLATEILASSLKSVGLFSQGARRIADLALDKPPAPYYERWLSVGIRYLQQQNTLADDLTFSREVRTLADLWAEWEAKREVWGANPNVQTEGPLLEACLKALPGILSGTQRATDVIFPNSSMRLVEGIYHGNALADYFNDALGATLTAGIDDRLRAGAESKVRILEI